MDFALILLTRIWNNSLSPLALQQLIDWIAGQTFMLFVIQSWKEIKCGTILSRSTSVKIHMIETPRGWQEEWFLDR